jgi:DNA primase small subunit
MSSTVAWTRKLLRRYYRRNPVYLPPRFGRREYGFLFVGQDGMKRHTTFATREDIGEFLVERGPAHAYYSAAYYEQPEASRMDDKGWLGADLIFDLDADHMPGHEEMTKAEMLEQVRVEALKVAEEFLVGHFGFDPEDMKIAFSGGRGYHIHVTDPVVHELGSAERREIVDYVTGNGIAISRLVRRETFSTEEVAGHVDEKQRWRLPAVGDPGWEGLFARELVDLLDEWRQLPREEALEAFGDLHGVGDKRAESLIDQLDEDAMAAVREGRVDSVPALANKTVIEAVTDRVRRAAIGEADEPVTADVHRLIRLPGSLHGRTGLRVTPLTLEGLKDFDPLVDAIALPADPVTLELEEPETGQIGGESFDLQPGTHEVPGYLAAFVAWPSVGTTKPDRPVVREGAPA